MNASEFIIESAVEDLKKKLPSLEKHNYTAIDSMVRKVAAKHRMNRDILSDLFAKKFKRTPSEWIDGKLDEEGSIDSDIAEEIEKFVDWASNVLHVKSKPKFELSMDTNQAQDGHHTGAHSPDSNHVWVYINNRNLVDILRTVFHELVHVRQGELGMIQPGDSYPGSPIESMADMLAGKYIKIYGEKTHHIFQ
jgi:hypothetical protein